MDAAKRPHIMILAGEYSGILYGSYVARKIMEICPAARLTGIGGSHMAEAGVEILFDRLKGNADIYLKHFKYDIRFDIKNARAEFAKVEKARANIEKSIYPLYRVLKDTSSGAKMSTLIRAFLLS